MPERVSLGKTVRLAPKDSATELSITASRKAYKSVAKLPTVLDAALQNKVSFNIGGREVAYGLVTAFGLYLVIYAVATPPTVNGLPDAGGTTSPSAPAPDNQPLLELENFRVTAEYGYSNITGEVKNISGKSLSDVEAEGTFYDAAGNLVKSDSSLIDYNPILPGQTSPFEVMTTTNPAIKSGSVTFKYMFGGTIATRRK